MAAHRTCRDNGGYTYDDRKMDFCYAKGSPELDIPRDTAHELFHAFQFGGQLANTRHTPAYIDMKKLGFTVNWIIEGTAAAAEDSAETMTRSLARNSDGTAFWSLHPIDKSLLASDKADGFTSEVIAYQAQDFWVFVATSGVEELGLGYLKGLFKRGVSLDAAVAFFDQERGISLGDAYWLWVKNQAIEKTITLGGALTDPGRIEIPRDTPVIGEDVPVIDFPGDNPEASHSVVRTLPILTAMVVRINITANRDSTLVTAGPLAKGLVYKAYLNGECTLEGGPCYSRILDGERTFDTLAKGDTIYVILANINQNPRRRVRFELNVGSAS
jgi:hypothetical protein